MSKTADKKLTVKKLCELYGIDKHSIYYWIRYKKFPFYKLGEKKILISQGDFESFLESQKVEVPSGAI